MLSEAEQNLVTALIKKCYESVKYKEKVKPKPKVWKPKCGDQYWFIRIDDDRVIRDAWLDAPVDNRRWALSNVFKTKEDAEFAIERQKVKVELQRYADEHNNPEKEEWDGINTHYSIYYDIQPYSIGIRSTRCCLSQNQIYFTPIEVLQDAINEIGEDRIKKYYFGMKEVCKR